MVGSSGQDAGVVGFSTDNVGVRGQGPAGVVGLGAGQGDTVGVVGTGNQIGVFGITASGRSFRAG